MTTYALDCAGAVMYRVTVPPAVHKMMASRAWLAARVVVVSVTSASALSVVVPATAASSKLVMELLTVSPQVPESSPCTGRARPSSDVAAVAIIYLYVALGLVFTITQVTVCGLGTAVHAGVWGLVTAVHPAS